MLEEGGPLIQDDRCPQRQGKFGDTHTHTHTHCREHHMKMKAEIGVMLVSQGPQRLPANHQKLRGRHGTDFSNSPKEAALLTP